MSKTLEEMMLGLSPARRERFKCAQAVCAKAQLA